MARWDTPEEVPRKIGRPKCRNLEILEEYREILDKAWGGKMKKEGLYRQKGAGVLSRRRQIKGQGQQGRREGHAVGGGV